MDTKDTAILACIFDLDGVLVDTAKYHFRSWIKLAETLGFEIQPELEEELKGISRMKSLEIVLKAGGIQADEEEKILYAKQKNDWYLESLENLSDEVILPGVIDFLDHLRDEGIPMAVGSASKNATFVLNQLNMTDYFVTIVDGTMVRQSKPDPEVFLNAARDLQYPPDKIIVFEDSAKGLVAAHKGGFHTIGIGDPEKLKEAAVVIPNFQKMKFNKLTMALELN